MLKAVSRFSLLAFGIPGFAPDEHRRRKLTNNRRCDDPLQEERCGASSFPSAWHGTALRDDWQALISIYDHGLHCQFPQMSYLGR